MDHELAEALGLPPTTPIHTVRIGAGEGRARILPTVLEVEPGHIVQFVVRDRGVYSVRFETDELSAEAADFLFGRGQESSPPLTEVDARFVVTFQEAPPGLYPYRVEGHGEAAQGRVRVVE